MKNIDLYGVNFIKAGTAINTDTRVNGADFKIDKEYKKAKGVVYLFVKDEEVLYIGVTEREIQQRMNMYSSNTTGSTNCKMRANLIEDIKYNIYIHIAEEVNIGTLKATNELTIEKCLIQQMTPKYNKKVM
ncbi:hypothetical protein [Sulfurimonas sp.]|uniref:hypothetical protein n=1 Tax=Sulfurimonas sp. TaxID=2022749 RepID=UPI002B492EAC|nr:hypothetical protein [Sulfurimonas sp.]